MKKEYLNNFDCESVMGSKLTRPRQTDRTDPSFDDVLGPFALLGQHVE